ncbi:MAG: pilus assembly FimT family protein, partial [bacterium]
MRKRGAPRFGRPTKPSQRVLNSPGFTLAELIVLIAVIAILAVMAVPAFLSYYHAAGLKAGAQQVVTLINQAREIAIKENGNVCVTLP